MAYLTPPVAAAHPFDDGTAATVVHSLADTAHGLGPDAEAYRRLLAPLVASWSGLANDVLAPLHFPKHPVDMAQFGLPALLPATVLTRLFRGEKAKGLFAGMAAHVMQPLSNLATSAVGLVLLMAAHCGGCPLPKGGSQAIADALVAHFRVLGGHVETGTYVRSLAQLSPARAVLLDVTLAQLLQLAGHNLSSIYQWQLRRYRYGMGCSRSIGRWPGRYPLPRLAAAKRAPCTWATPRPKSWPASGPRRGVGTRRGPSCCWPSKACLSLPAPRPAGQHTAWAYCHVPNGSRVDRTAAIEQQVERFAPGFRERIIGRHTFDIAQLERYNPNYVGDNINGGLLDINQLLTRPALRASPYRTSRAGLYLCSLATPPGGVHGMCGYHAARRALRDVFQLAAPPLPGLT